jgi:hypothetical protein
MNEVPSMSKYYSQGRNGSTYSSRVLSDWKVKTEVEPRAMKHRGNMNVSTLHKWNELFKTAIDEDIESIVLRPLPTDPWHRREYDMYIHHVAADVSLAQETKEKIRQQLQHLALLNLKKRQQRTGVHLPHNVTRHIVSFL